MNKKTINYLNKFFGIFLLVSTLILLLPSVLADSCMGTLNCGLIDTLGGQSICNSNIFNQYCYFNGYNCVNKVADCTYVTSDKCNYLSSVGCTWYVSECTSGKTRCLGVQIQTCNSSGQWGDLSDCQTGYSCDDSSGSGQCVPSCIDGTTQSVSCKEVIANSIDAQKNQTCTNRNWEDDLSGCKLIGCKSDFYTNISSNMCDDLVCQSNTNQCYGTHSDQVQTCIANAWINSTDCNASGQACRDGRCVSALNGWTPDVGTNFAVDPTTKYLIVKGPGTLITDYTFDVLAGKNYTFSYLGGSDTCNVVIDFYDELCLSNTSFKRKGCFVSDNSDKKTLTGVNKNITLTIPSANDNAVNGVYFKDVVLRLNFNAGCANVKFYNLSLKQSDYITDGVVYNLSQVPSRDITTESSCCPSDFCWNGTTCVNSGIWTSNSSQPGIWSIDGANGYRCIDNTTVPARWVFSKLKYDWNHNASGYCADENGCYVREEYRGTDGAIDDCVGNNTFSDEKKINNSGNHYCYEGNWTTKTYIAATKLQDLAEKSKFPYILHCYDDPSVTYNSPKLLLTDATNIVSSCVLTLQLSTTKDQIVTAVMVNDDEKFLQDIYAEYRQTYNGSQKTPVDISADLSKIQIPLAICTDVDNNDILECVAIATPIRSLYLYYDNTSKYFLMSESPITGITPLTFMQKLINFFANLFSSTKEADIGKFYTNPVENYNRIYLMREPNRNVTAVEEEKYDTVEKKMMTTLYLTYNTTKDVMYNPLNKDELTAYVNKTMIDAHGTTTIIFVNYVNDSNNQLVLIKSESKTDIWPYLTAMLRNRPN